MRMRTPGTIRAPGSRNRGLIRPAISRFSEVLLVVGALALLPACNLDFGDFMNPCGEGGCASPAPQDCAALSRTSWRVGLLAGELNLTVGQSERELLWPRVEPQCANALVSVTWTADDPSVASVLPQGSGSNGTAWITGVAPGLTAVRARIVFSDGGTQDAQAESVRVVPPGPPSGNVVVAEGEVNLPAPPSQSLASYHFVPFTLGASGQVDITVDWGSPLNVLNFSVYKSPCTSIGACGDIVINTRVFGVKPLPASGALVAGDYTIRIDNLGPGPETARFEVRLTPR
jgi:hypothetical protein